ncbi:TIR domain-containing protein [Paenibacillaceae bacterium WGS1546]|uniref:TIR domain-containing protein n=1 Tax=Cohnella sp. WGS1546 TaxID=3366810 RepID=UPI00372D0B73
MAHKTFISYKYSEACDLRDSILDSLGEDAVFYKGETSDSPDLTDTSTENIKKCLTDMMYDTSVTIVIISPNMKESEWIDWEIEYSLKNITRKGRTSHTNGVVGVIMKYNGAYDWFKYSQNNSDGCSSFYYHDHKVYDIINNNRFNQNPKVYSCDTCKTVSALSGSYIAFVEEETFLSNPQKYIDDAYDKSEDNASGYDLVKTR